MNSELRRTVIRGVGVRHEDTSTRGRSTSTRGGVGTSTRGRTFDVVVHTRAVQLLLQRLLHDQPQALRGRHEEESDGLQGREYTGEWRVTREGDG